MRPDRYRIIYTDGNSGFSHLWPDLLSTIRNLRRCDCLHTITRVERAY